MRNLIGIAMELSRELHTLKAIVKLRFAMLSNPVLSPLLEGSQVMTALNISRKTLEHYRKKGVIPFIRIGGKIYYPANELIGLLESRKTKRQ